MKKSYLSFLVGTVLLVPSLGSGMAYGMENIKVEKKEEKESRLLINVKKKTKSILNGMSDEKSKIENFQQGTILYITINRFLKDNPSNKEKESFLKSIKESMESKGKTCENCKNVLDEVWISFTKKETIPDFLEITPPEEIFMDGFGREEGEKLLSLERKKMVEEFFGNIEKDINNSVEEKAFKEANKILKLVEKVCQETPENIGDFISFTEDRIEKMTKSCIGCSKVGEFIIKKLKEIMEREMKNLKLDMGKLKTQTDELSSVPSFSYRVGPPHGNRKKDTDK